MSEDGRGDVAALAELDELITTKGHVLADGAMGTQLFDAGLGAGDPPELWNRDRPETIRAIHRSYIAAGSDLVLTNSFGGTRFRLTLHDLQDQVIELNRAAASNARAEADEVSRTVIVAGSMGPSGELLEPLGAMTAAACEEAFAEQARGLDSGGADMLWIETMSDLDEVEAAVRGARSACRLPIAVAMSFDTAGRTMMGVAGAQLAERLAPLDLVAIGANCGANLTDTEAAVTAIAAGAGEIPVICKPNAGIPVWSGESLAYDGTPEVLAASAVRASRAGAAIIGGCCGSTPEHIARIAAALR